MNMMWDFDRKLIDREIKKMIENGEEPYKQTETQELIYDIINDNDSLADFAISVGIGLYDVFMISNEKYPITIDLARKICFKYRLLPFSKKRKRLYSLVADK